MHPAISNAPPTSAHRDGLICDTSKLSAPFVPDDNRNGSALCGPAQIRNCRASFFHICLERLEHAQRGADPPEGRHDVDPLHQGARARSAPPWRSRSPPRAARPHLGPAHPLADRLGDLHPGHLVVQELGVAVARQREDAYQDRDAAVGDPVEETRRAARVS